jgi:hypothetical protein
MFECTRFQVPSESRRCCSQNLQKKMDSLLFSEEDELRNSILNSEDSNQTRREEIERDEMDDDNRIIDSVSAEDESLRQVENERQSPQGMNQEEHARKFVDAQTRRQRTRRFASFASWVPNLQSVWAPKQPEAMKPDPLRNLTMSTVQLQRAVSRSCSVALHAIILCYSECSIHLLAIQNMTVCLNLIPH